ncbi:MAG: HAMP domain-containing histidine kinase [Deltaproteobacteria bacterium]|nr:HAMP domain-containing histidine kinase [Deltaproteobacteria bacterium]
MSAAPPTSLPAPASGSIARAADEPRAASRWLTQLRWASIAGQLVTIMLAATVTDVALDLGVLLALVGVGAASNLALALTPRERAGTATTIALVLVLDVLLLTGLLLAAGGPANPFSIFYLVHVVLAGLLLGTRGAWAMAALTSVGFGLLFLLPNIPLDEHAMHHHGASSLHLQGMWIAYALAAVFVATFVSGLARALARREAELARLRQRAERGERLAALGTFSASAAHELGSPLSTIAVTVHELERGLARLDPAPAGVASLVDDARLIRAEADRCRGLLHDLTRRGGLVAGEALEVIGTGALWDEVALRLGNRPGLVITRAPDAVEVALSAPRVALVQALCNLVDNAHDASRAAGRADAPVIVGTRRVGARVRLWVRDAGGGFTPEVLAELGQAFVTTRPGEGLGLGLHLAEALMQALGGRLDVASSAQGSEVALELPCRDEEASR